MFENKIHVATININNNKPLTLYESLGKALAPLKIYITPIIQETDLLKKEKHDCKINLKDFLNLIKKSKKVKHKACIYEDFEKKQLFIYVNKSTFKNSTYNDKNFIKNVYGQDNLPIYF